MSNNIDLQRLALHTDIINDMLRWTEVSLSKTKHFQRELRTNLVENRRNISKIRKASLLNPAVAIFGESQVGKSYMVDSLLSDKRGAFSISNGMTGDDAKVYGFLEEMDPNGKGGESTAVVCRFTTRQIERAMGVPADFAFRVHLLSVKDIILVLVDSFYNDINIKVSDDNAENSPFITEQALRIYLDELKAKYAHGTKRQDCLSEDDLYDLRDYFIGPKALDIYLNDDQKSAAYGEYLNAGYASQAGTYVKSRFFEELGSFIGNIPDTELAGVFSFLWLNDPVFTQTFEDLLNLLRELKFSQEVYVKAEALLRKHGTILDVTRINETYDPNVDTNHIPDYTPTMEVYASGQVVKGVRKGIFCALTLEIVFQLPTYLIEEKPFLAQLDLLDFPGARSRERYDYSSGLSKPMMGQLLRRGKVAYLFNDFSANYKISTLIFCHHKEQNNVKTIGPLIEGWVNNYVGRTPRERDTFITEMGASPLFIVSTKFNLDMKREGTENLNTDFGERWNSRFNKMLKEIFNQSAWFSSWRAANAPFDNSYLLRSFQYSATDGIFTGYYRTEDGVNHINVDEQGLLVGEQSYGTGYEMFLAKMGEAFTNFDYVKEHFADPARSWAEVASVGRDGSQWIIENLSIAARGAELARSEKFKRLLLHLCGLLGQHIRQHYHDDNSDEQLKKAMSTAGSVELQLDIIFGRDKHFFSQFLSRMMISESQIYDILLEVLNNQKILDETDASAYFAIRNSAGLDPNLEREENIDRLKRYYVQDSAEALERFLEDRGVDIELLLSPKLTKNIAAIFTDSIVEVWTEQHLAPERFADFVARGFGEYDLCEFLANTRNLFLKELHLPRLIIEKIGKYVKNNATLDAITEMLADICSEMINRFVRDLGYSYYNEDRWASIVETKERIGDTYKLNTDISIYDVQVDTDDRGEITKIFDALDRMDEILNQMPPDPVKLAYIPHYAHYKRWTDLMKISFLAACNTPTYDVEANNRLRPIVERYEGELIPIS